MGKAANQDYYWLLVTQDKYRLPIVVADSLEELSNMIGISRRSISHAMSKTKIRGGQCKYEKVRKEA